jgi:hypothetical protein
MFNVTRRDMGEFAFFMSQPVAITAEDFVQWVWRRLRGSGESGRCEMIVGYVWVCIWFSLSLQLYIKGLVDAEVIRDWVFGATPMEVGEELSLTLLKW